MHGMMAVGAWLALAVGALPVGPVGGGNALTLPAQRHLVWVEPGGGPGVFLLAVQQGGSEGRGLGFFRSDDEGRTWRYLGPIQDDATHPDRADLLVVGRDVALVYSVETPASQGITGSLRHDVYFQWWRYRPTRGEWAPDPAVKVFDSASPRTAYYRAELARDSRGRLWVQAFKLEAHGKASVVVAVSEDDGATFRQQPRLDEGLRFRGGGRLLSLGDRLLVLYDMHDSGHSARFRIRDDSAPLDSWEPVRTAFPEGIYHGAALSAVPDGRGGLHLVYKDEAMVLGYRHFDGRTFGPRQVLERGDWAMQPAVTLVGDELVVFYNRPKVPGRAYELRMRRLRDGRLGPAQVLDETPRFKGYLAAAERVPRGVGLPCAFGSARHEAAPGQVELVVAPPHPEAEEPARGAESSPDGLPRDDSVGEGGAEPPASTPGAGDVPLARGAGQASAKVLAEGAPAGCASPAMLATLHLVALGLLCRWGVRAVRSRRRDG